MIVTIILILICTAIYLFVKGTPNMFMFSLIDEIFRHKAEKEVDNG